MPLLLSKTYRDLFVRNDIAAQTSRLLSRHHFFGQVPQRLATIPTGFMVLCAKISEPEGALDIWNITITSPLGVTAAKLHLAEDGSNLRGQMTGQGGAGPINAGQIKGDQLSWTCKIEKPMPMTLAFKGRRQGGEISGKVKFGMFASGHFVATRDVPQNEATQHTSG